MTDLKQSFRRFLTTEISPKERENLGKMYGLDLAPGATFKDALDARFEGIRGGGGCD